MSGAQGLGSRCGLWEAVWSLYPSRTIVGLQAQNGSQYLLPLFQHFFDLLTCITFDVLMLSFFFPFDVMLKL